MTLAIDNVDGTKDLTAKRQKRRTFTSVAFFVHSASGLWFTVLLSIVLVTGTLTVLFQEIDWLLYDQMRVTPQETRANPGKMYDALKATYPDFGINNLNTGAFNDRLAASSFVLAPDGGGFRLVWVDQYSGTVTGDTPFLTVGRFLNLLHTSLFLPVIGRSIVNFFGVLMLISLLTGLMTYKKFWRGFFTRPRFNRNTRTWLGDLHRLGALWSVWLIAIIGITGSWWFYEDPLVERFGAPGIVEKKPEVPKITIDELNQLGPETPKHLSAALLVDKVRAQYPNLIITNLRPPQNAAEPFLVQGDLGEALVARGGNFVYVNPYTGKIMGDYLVQDWSITKRLDAATHPLHYGSWAKSGTADLIIKIVWFLGGCILSFLAISGLVIYLKRTASSAKDIVPLSGVLKSIWQWVNPWGGPMGAFKYINILFVVGIVMGTVLVLTLGSRGIEDKGRVFAEQSVGPFKIKLRAIAGLLEADLPPIRPGAKADVFVKVADQRFKDARFIRIWAGSSDILSKKAALVEGDEGIAHADLRLPKELEGASLWVEIEGWDGKKYRNHWAL